MHENFELDNIKKRDKISIFVLGSNFPESEREKRANVCLDLRNQRQFLNTFIMEDKCTPDKYKYFDDAFKDFIHDSHMIIAILTQQGSKDGIGWEIGFMQGIDTLSESFDIREKLFLCLENDIETKPELTQMISNGIVKKSGCRIVKFSNINELCDTLESLAHSQLMKTLSNN
ncbi:MAG: hypothetical protein HY514_01825 [Candidatus Aenigmarchaeota archaeon]|nr:hypothetical protein [Candidatus Aenigmarchaeota archaeon]